MPSGIYEAYMEKLLEETYVLPIHSNPTRRDSDADGLNDMNDKYDSVTMDERYAKLSPLKINTIETLYPELQLYDSNINNNRQNAVYFDINGNVIVEEIDSQYPGRESYVTFNVDNMDYVENKFTELLSEYCSYGIPHTQNVVIHWSPDSVGVAVGGSNDCWKNKYVQRIQSKI